MSLERYRRPRMVVLNPRSSALEAARAMENNQIGAILVQDQGRLLGIVTDRDLAVRVTAYGRDASSTPIGDVMTVDVATLPPGASQEEAVRLMRERNVRRVPLVEGDRVEGVVTLDDLLLDEAAPLDEVAAVVRAQLGAGGPAPTRRFGTSRAEERRLARSEAKYRRLVRQVQTATGLEPSDPAEAALAIVLAALVRRLTPQEATDLIAQLPSALHDSLLALPAGPDRSIGRETIASELAARLDVDPTRADEILVCIGAVLEQNVSAGEIDDVLSQLPLDMHPIFPSGGSRITAAAPPP